MIALEHHGTALTQLVHFVFDTVIDNTNQCTDDEDATQCDDQHHQQKERTASVSAHGSGV